MELRELEWFITLAETEHVTIAASRLHISQPTLSRALARIERTLDVQLFDRHQNRLHLNKYGEIFKAHAMRAMDEMARGRERITTLVDPERGTISLGFLHSFGGWLVPDLVNQYREIAPTTSFELHGNAAETVVHDVRSGRIDFGFVAPRPTADDLQWVPLGREDLCLGVPPGHRFEGLDHIGVADLVEESILALKVGYGLREVMDRLFWDAGVSPCIDIEVTELSTLRALVSSGMGVAIVPAPQPGHPSTTSMVPLSDPGAFRDYGAVARKYGPSGSVSRRFLQFIATMSPQTQSPEAQAGPKRR